MAKIVIAGNSAVVVSTLTLDELKLVEKYEPKALRIVEKDDDGKKSDKFLLSTEKGGAGSLSCFGAVFTMNSRTPGEGACITLSLSGCPEDTEVKEYVSDKYGAGLMCLNDLEEKLPEVIEKINAKKAAIADHITVSC